jgi:putative membrane protein
MRNGLHTPPVCGIVLQAVFSLRRSLMRINVTRENFPVVLAAVFTVFFALLGIAPASRAVWIAEVIPLVSVFALLVVTYRFFRFSNIAYGLMAVWLFWHTVGAHFTFSEVPFGAVTELLGGGRNHFDRIGHFSVGFYAYAMCELFMRRRLAGPVVSTLFALFFIMSVAAGYEIIEWWYAAAEGGDAGVAFLGSQGDVWDAQKDMLADTLGAVFSLLLFWTMGRRWGSRP